MKSLESTPSARTASPLWSIVGPGVFIFMWSTGFIGAKWGLPYAEPFTLLTMRFAIAASVFTVLALVTGAPWPRTRREYVDSIVVAVFIHGIYLTGVFWAIDRGTPAWVAGLIAGSQPLLASVLAGPTLGEKVTPRQWCGFGLGFLGVATVVWRGGGDGDIGPGIGIAVTVVGLIALTFGTLYQKRHGGGTDLRTGQAVQQIALTVILGILALSFETNEIEWTPDFLFALGWLSLVLSTGMFSLLFSMLRRGTASTVSSLFFLVPPLTALEAHLLFGETLGGRDIAGMALAAAGVALVTWRRRAPA